MVIYIINTLFLNESFFMRLLFFIAIILCFGNPSISASNPLLAEFCESPSFPTNDSETDDSETDDLEEEHEEDSEEDSEEE